MVWIFNTVIFYMSFFPTSLLVFIFKHANLAVHVEQVAIKFCSSFTTWTARSACLNIRMRFLPRLYSLFFFG
jgi:hypothetical protein